MEKKIRTLEELRNGIKGKIYIYIDNEKIGKQFLQNAEAEGYRFGKVKPTISGSSNIIALKKNKQLSYVGFVGHVEFQCGGNGDLTRIDYEKYINGNRNFLFENKPITEITIQGKFFKEINIVGDNSFEVAEILKAELQNCNNEDEEIALCERIGDEYDVLALPDFDEE